jgi:small subunit ribosomal protein S8
VLENHLGNFLNFMDQIANMLVMIQNASHRGHEKVIFPYSEVKLQIANCLEKAGFLKNASKKVYKGKNSIEVEIVYDANGTPKLHKLERVSKLSRRVYMGVSDLRPIKNGLGHYILTTPKGILIDTDAKKEQVGGEVILSVW